MNTFNYTPALHAAQSSIGTASVPEQRRKGATHTPGGEKEGPSAGTNRPPALPLPHSAAPPCATRGSRARSASPPLPWRYLFFCFSPVRLGHCLVAVLRMFCKQRRGRGSAPHTWVNVGNSPSMATQQGARHQKGAPTLLPRGTGTVRCLRLAPVCSPYRALPQTTQTANPPYSTPH